MIDGILHKGGWGQWTVALGLGLIVGYGGVVVASQKPTTENLPLAVQVQRILKIRPGKAPYLPSLARLVKAIHGHHFGPPGQTLQQLKKEPVKEVIRHARQQQMDTLRQLEAVFSPHRADVRSLVNALNHGTNPVALRNKILQALTIDGHYVLPHGKVWRYGTLVDRMGVAGYLHLRAWRLLIEKHRRRAALDARAALLLDCQEDTQLSDYILARFVPKGIQWPHEFAGLWRAESPTRYLMRATLGLTTGQMKRLEQVYRSAQRRQTGLGGYKAPYNQAIMFVYHILKVNYKGDQMVICEHGPFSKAIVQRYVNYLRGGIAAATTASDLHWSYLLLGNIWADRQLLAHYGHHRISGKLRVVLQHWAAKIKASRNLPPLERQALLRWIQEASQ